MRHNISKSLEAMLKTIYADKSVNLVEFQALAQEADQRWERVIGALDEASTLVAFQKAMDVACHLLHLSVQELRGEDFSLAEKSIVKDAILSQVEYLRAGALMSTALLFEEASTQ